MKLSFTVNGPPVPKARARVVHGPDGTEAFTPTKTREYEKHVARVAAAHLLGKAWPLDRAYSVSMTVYRAAARGDWDNYAKAICDALNGIVYADDRQVRRAEVLIVDRDPKPRVVVEIETI